jgi:hypothetical protein
VLVSIQSLILVSEPYFNEPGFERSRGTPSGNHSSREYNSNIYQACVKWAMLEQIRNPSPCFKDVIYTHFWLKRNEICQQIESWIAELSRPQVSERSGRAISFNSMVLRRQYRQLREELAKLPVPPGLENFDNPFSANPPASSNVTLPPLPTIQNSTAQQLQQQSLSCIPDLSKMSELEAECFNEEQALIKIFNTIEEQKKSELDMLMQNVMSEVTTEIAVNANADDDKPENDNNMIVEELSSLDSSLDLLEKANKTMKDIEKILSDE